MPVFYWRAQVLIPKLYKGGGDQDLYFCLARFCFVFLFFNKISKGKNMPLCCLLCDISWYVRCSFLHNPPLCISPVRSPSPFLRYHFFPQDNAAPVPIFSCALQVLSLRHQVSITAFSLSSGFCRLCRGKRWTPVCDWYQRRVKE